LCRLGWHRYRETGGKNPYADWHPMLPDLEWFKQLINLPEFQTIHPQSVLNCACKKAVSGDWDFVRELIRINPEALILPDDLHMKEYSPDGKYASAHKVEASRLTSVIRNR
jgi:hypothetical protein